MRVLSFQCLCGFAVAMSAACASSNNSDSDPDVDACALGTHTCDPIATCTNTTTGFDCECPAGYDGDGTVCQLTEIDNIDEDGGTISTITGTTLDIPAGAVTSETQIILTEGASAPASFPETLDVLGPVIELSPAGGTFDPPLKLSVNYDQQGMIEGGIEELLIGVHFIEASGEVEEAFILERDLAANTVTVEIGHFGFLAATRWAIGGVVDGSITALASVQEIDQRVNAALDTISFEDAEAFADANQTLLEAYFAASRVVLPLFLTVSVTGLNGSGLVLQNNGGDDLAVTQDGVYEFSTAVGDGAVYTVTVLSQPASPQQICTLTNDNGFAGFDAPAIQVTCEDTFQIDYETDFLELQLDQPMDPRTPNTSIAPGVRFLISPFLPSGLNFSTLTGRISGTPTALSDRTTYTVTATTTDSQVTTFDLDLMVSYRDIFARITPQNDEDGIADESVYDVDNGYGFGSVLETDGFVLSPRSSGAEGNAIVFNRVTSNTGYTEIEFDMDSESDSVWVGTNVVQAEGGFTSDGFVCYSSYFDASWHVEIVNNDPFSTVFLNGIDTGGFTMTGLPVNDIDFDDGNTHRLGCEATETTINLYVDDDESPRLSFQRADYEARDGQQGVYTDPGIGNFLVGMGDDSSVDAFSVYQSRP